MKLNNGHIQDLYHYAIAMIGEENGMDAHTLRQRLDCADSVYSLLTTFDEGQEVDANFFEPAIPLQNYRHEADLQAAGRMLRDKVSEWAALHGIDAYSGKYNTVKCVT